MSLYKFNESNSKIIEDTNLQSSYYGARIYTSMQDREFLIISKNKELVYAAFDLFIDLVNSFESTEDCFNKFDEFIKHNDMVYLDSETNLKYSAQLNRAYNTETGEVYDIELIHDYSSRF